MKLMFRIMVIMAAIAVYFEFGYKAALGVLIAALIIRFLRH